MDGLFDPDESAYNNIAGLIRSANSGMCSGQPKNVYYPGVPFVEEILEELGLKPNDKMTEEQWRDACFEVLGR